MAGGEVTGFFFDISAWMFPKIVSFRPKSSTLVRFSIINHPFWGTPNFLKQPWMVCVKHPTPTGCQPSGLLHVLVSEIQAKLFLFQ